MKTPATILVFVLCFWQGRLIQPRAYSASETAAPPAEAKSLITKLGDPSFAEREAATNKLAQMDVSVRELLTQAIQSRDAEVRWRARRVLAVVNERYFQQRLAEFSADVEDKQGLDLPGWSRFKQMVGRSPGARELFIEMQRAEPNLLETAESKLGSVSEILTDRLNEAFQAPQFGAASNTSAASAAAVVFVATDPNLKLSAETAEMIGAFVYQPAFYSALTGNRSAELKKLLEAWVTRDSDDDALLIQNVGIALNQGLPAGRALAKKALAKKQLSPEGLRLSMSLLARTGKTEDAALLATFLKDETVLNHFNPNQADRDVLKVCDYAMAMMLHLTGSNPLEFRNGPLRWHQGWNAELQTLAFPSEQDRRTASDKWSTWWSTHADHLKK
jgi:hypothetical protein